MTTSTTTTDSLSTTRQVQFTVEGVVSLAWKKAQMINISAEPTPAEQEFARKHLLIVMDEVASQARIARAVIRDTITTVAGQAAYTLSADIMDVVGTGTYTADGSSTDLQMNMMGREDYLRCSDKTVEGVPTGFYPEKGSRVIVYLWPVPQSDDATVTLQCVKWLYDTTAGSQTIDLERYFTGYLVTRLAYEIATANSKPLMFCQALQAEAKEKLFLCLGSAKQRGPTRFIMAHRTQWSGGRR